jgi:hypothetical protein
MAFVIAHTNTGKNFWSSIMQTDDIEDFNAGDRAVGLVTKGTLLFMFFHVLAEFIDLYF